MKSLGIIFLITFLSGCSAIPQCTTKTTSFSIPDGIPFVDGAFAIVRDNTHTDCGKTVEQLEQDEIDRARLGIRLWSSGEDDE
jgi:hypothetical protein